MAILPVVRSMPVDHSQISSQESDVIDRQVASMQLSADELRQHGERLDSNPAYKAVFNAKVSRVLTLKDGVAKIYDLTRGKIVGFRQCCNRLMLGEAVVTGPQYRGIKWGREHHTDYVVVRDNGENSVEIFEQEIARGSAAPLQNTFKVDLTENHVHSYQAQCEAGHVYLHNEVVCLIKEVSPQLQEAWNAERAAAASEMKVAQ